MFEALTGVLGGKPGAISTGFWCSVSEKHEGHMFTCANTCLLTRPQVRLYEGETHNGVHISGFLVKTDGMFPGVVVTDLDGTHACNIGSVYINLTCFEYRSTEDPHILSSASDRVIPIAMVSVVTPDEPQESTPLRFEDLSRSELVNLVKVRDVSMDSARLSMLTTPQDLQLENSKLRAELRTLNTTRVVSAPTEKSADPLSDHRVTQGA